MKVLVTGGGGFLGTWVCKELLSRHYEVYSFSRHPYPHLQDMGVKCIVGNLSHKSDVLNAFKGFSVVFHVAALADVWGKYDDFYQVNVVGTENVIEACKVNGIPRLIFTSSPSVVFGKDDLMEVDETCPYPESYLCAYAETKSIAEKLVVAANSSELTTVTIRPHLIWGPGDPHLFPRLIQSARAGKLKRVGDGENLVDIIYVENAARAHVEAFEVSLSSGHLAGQVYFIGQDEPVHLWDFINTVLRGHDIEPIEDMISFRMAYIIGFFMEKVFSLLGIKKPAPPMTRFVACQLAKSHYFSHLKAKKDFGFRPLISTEEGLTRVFKIRNKEIISTIALEKINQGDLK